MSFSNKILLCFLGFLPCFIISDDYLNFNASVYEEITEDIKQIYIEAPEKGKYMKQAEYKKLYDNYIETQRKSELYKYDVGSIHVGCGYSRSFCYDVEEEHINFSIFFEEHIKYDESYYDGKIAKPRFNITFDRRTDYSSYDGQTQLQQNIGKITEVIKTVSHINVLTLRYPKVFGDVSEGVSLPITINEIKDKEDSYSAYLIFSVPHIDRDHNTRGRTTYSKEPTISNPTDEQIIEYTLMGDYIGFIIEHDGEVIYDSINAINLIAPNMVADEYLPIKTFAAVYPRRAQERGTEGYVAVAFTVNEKGNVQDIRILEGKCGKNNDFRDCTIFNSSAIRAAEKFKYEPKTENGSPIKTYDVSYKFTFILSD